MFMGFIIKTKAFIASPCGENGFSKARCAFVFLLSLVLSASVSGASDRDAEAWRNAASKLGEAVVTVKSTARLRVVVEGREAQKSEQEIETPATIIDPSGLAVLSYSAVDPSRVYGEMMKQSRGGSDLPKYSMDTEITEIKMVMPDGTEVPSSLVMRDKDLDMVFIRPSAAPEKPYKFIDLSASARPELLDSVVVLSRLGAVAGRSITASVYRIESIIRKPRTYYVIDQNAVSGRLGAPVLAGDRVAGIMLLRLVATEGKQPGFGDMFGGIGKLGLLPVILPADDVSEVAKQAAAIKAE